MHDPVMGREPVLTGAERRLIEEARRAVLATTDPTGRPRLVPICYALAEADPRAPCLYMPIDEKPKASPDPRMLARIRDLLAVPDVVVLIDRWDEDWEQLAWVRLYGRAELVEPGARDEHAQAVAALRRRYGQYRDHRLEDRPVVRLTVERATSWSTRPG
jgi:PPOX class probable F420-dependent enzyme